MGYLVMAYIVMAYIVMATGTQLIEMRKKSAGSKQGQGAKDRSAEVILLQTELAAMYELLKQVAYLHACTHARTRTQQVERGTVYGIRVERFGTMAYHRGQRVIGEDSVGVGDGMGLFVFWRRQVDMPVESREQFDALKDVKQHVAKEQVCNHVGPPSPATIWTHRVLQRCGPTQSCNDVDPPSPATMWTHPVVRRCGPTQSCNDVDPPSRAQAESEQAEAEHAATVAKLEDTLTERDMALVDRDIAAVTPPPRHSAYTHARVYRRIGIW